MSGRPRRCGGCAACCAPGCGCHPRPARTRGCGGFTCLWLLGVGEARHRPDRVGVLLAPAPGEPLTAWAFELEPGAVRAGEGRALVDAVARRLPVVVAEEAGLGVVLSVREPTRPRSARAAGAPPRPRRGRR